MRKNKYIILTKAKMYTTKIICSVSHWGFQLFIYLILSCNRTNKQNDKENLTVSFPYEKFHPKPTTICIFLLLFLFVISYHRQHHRFTLCRQCLVCILMSNTHRAEAVINSDNWNVVFWCMISKERTLHKRRAPFCIKKTLKLWLLRCWLYHIFISSRKFVEKNNNKCNDNLHTLLTKTMSFIALSLSLSLF